MIFFFYLLNASKDSSNFKWIINVRLRETVEKKCIYRIRFNCGARESQQG